ncbi:MAG TPA: adenylosuccinate synthase [Polyangia bacterium]|nr:adenylosuccinate synthase [Polyangia bacterium]
MAVVIVVGVQWGDEGKGKIVDLLTEKARFVVRWAGGANAGHTLVVEGKKYVTRLIPSGILRDGVTCVLGEGMVIDPAVLVDEIRTFRGHGFIKGTADLVVAERAHLTLPHHLDIDRLREDGPGGIGTTKKGIGPTYESKAARIGLRMGDLLRPERFRARLDRHLAVMAPSLKAHGVAVPDAGEVTARYLALAEEIRPFVGDASRTVHGAVVRGDNVLFEGAQGVLLDLDHGTYPFVTSSSTTAGGACAGLGIGPTKIDTVVGVAKGYATRVGDGPFPTELTEATGDLLRKKGHEFGSVTGRPRRCGWLDIPALKLAVRLSGIESLALTKLDVLAGLERVKICVGYRFGGRTLDEMPVDLDDLAAAEPVFEELDGWPDSSAGSVGSVGSSGSTGATVPAAAARFVERVSALVGIPVWATSWGPGRSQTVVSRDPFAG